MKSALVALAALVATAAAAPTNPSNYDTCYAEWLKCKQAPDANNAQCAAQISNCLGYNPFTGNSSPSSTTASSATSTAAFPSPTNTKESVCYGKFYDCKGKPNANQAQCAADLSGCLGYNPFAPSSTTAAPSTTSAAYPTPTNSKEAVCYDNFYKCKAGPNANNAQCVADLSGCLGYNPFAPSSTTAASSTTSAAYSTPTNSKEAVCYDKFYKCKAGPDANNAQCAAEISSCLGYNPFAPSSTTAAPSTTSATYPTPTNSKEALCYDQFYKCKAGPNANQATCVAGLAGCLGYNPFAQSSTTQTGPAATTTTVVVSSFTTYCPEPTTISWGTNTYTVTKATTLTITDCPCTLTHSIPPTTPVVHPPTTTPCTTSSSAAPPPPPSTTPCTTTPVKPVQKPPVWSNTTTPCTTSTAPPPPPPASTTPRTTLSTQAPPPPPPSSYTPPPPPAVTSAPPAPPATTAPPAPSVTTPSTTKPMTTAPSTTRPIVSFTGAAAPMARNGGVAAAMVMGAVAFLV